MKVSFTIMGEPCGKGRPRFSNKGSHTYTPAKTSRYENLVKLEYERQCMHRFADDEQLDMRIYAYYGVPKSDSKKKAAQKLSGIIRPAKKPDMDNVMKIVADSLNGIAYRDDTQIVDSMVRKFYSDRPRVQIIIQTARRDSDDGQV